MPKPSKSSISWSLALTAIIMVGAWTTLIVHRTRAQQQAIAIIAEIEAEEEIFSIAVDGPCISSKYRVKVRDPITFEPQGPDKVRAYLGSETCRTWLDAPVAINLSNSLAEDADVRNLRHLPTLKKVDLVETKITDAGLIVLRELTELEELRIGSDQITDVGIKNITSLGKLREVLLSGPHISDLSLSETSRLPKLQVLTISSPRLTDKGLQRLAQHKQLRSLRISAPLLTDRALSYIGQIPCLRSLHIINQCHITDEALAQFKSDRPALNVLYEPYGPPP
ncbi:MAG TPA: hypothetical protein VGM05_01535 [Planctomycetaceae bacterium]